MAERHPSHVSRHQRSSNGPLGFDDSGFIWVGMADPLEGSAEEAVAFFAWNYVDVQVGDALRDFDVDRDERSVRQASQARIPAPHAQLKRWKPRP